MRNIPQVHSQAHSQAQKSLDPAVNGADESCADECADTPGTDNPADHWSIHLPGFELTHIVHLASVANLDVVSRVAARLKDHETSVANFAVSRSGDLLDQKIVLRDIGERSAEALREALLVLDGVLRARVEHRFVRAGAKR